MRQQIGLWVKFNAAIGAGLCGVHYHHRWVYDTFGFGVMFVIGGCGWGWGHFCGKMLGHLLEDLIVLCIIENCIVQLDWQLH